MNEPIIGIDLGTTNSEAAFIIDGSAQVFTDHDSGIIPSVVGLDSDSNIIVGMEARNQAVVVPDRTVMSIKRLMGSDETVKMGDAAYRPQEISAFILKYLKARAVKAMGRDVKKAVITVPAYFTDSQRQATREAGMIAGLEVVRIINEPTAAALAYESQHSETRRILIFDLGGGTFDVSIVKIENQVVEVLSSTGDNHLGGDDFDRLVCDRLIEYCKKEYGISVENDPVVVARLTRAAESAKIRLSFEPFVIIEEDHIGKKNGNDVHLSYELSRTDFEDMIRDHLLQTMESVNKALNDAELLASHIDKIILVGGSTRIPEISNMLEIKFGRRPHSEIDPDLCVALGAAIQAGREMGIDSSSVLLDITPYTFGTSAIGEVDDIVTPFMYVPLIRRNTKLPASRTEAFCTIADDQEAAKISVFQGENPLSIDNINLGTYHFDLTKAPRGSIILLNYALDVNGILKIEAIEKNTGRRINAVIEKAFDSMTEQDLEESRKRIEQMWGEPFENLDEIDIDEDGIDDDVEAGETGIDSEGMPEDLTELLERAEEKITEASDEDRDEIVDLMVVIKEAFRNNDRTALEKAREDLEDILFYLE